MEKRNKNHKKLKDKIINKIKKNLLFILFIMFIFILILIESSNMQKKQFELDEKIKEVQAIEDKAQEAKIQASVSEEEYMLNYAREEMGYAFPDEKIYKSIN